MDWKNKIDEMKNGKIDLQAACTELEILLDKYDWFYCSIVENNSICVYVNHMNHEMMSLVPMVLYGYSVKVAFSAHLVCGEKYGKISASSDILNMLQETK